MTPRTLENPATGVTLHLDNASARAGRPHTPVEHRLARWRGYRSGSGPLVGVILLPVILIALAAAGCGGTSTSKGSPPSSQAKALSGTVTAEQYIAWCKNPDVEPSGPDDWRTWGDARDAMEERLDRSLRFEIAAPVELSRFHNAKIKAWQTFLDATEEHDQDSVINELEFIGALLVPAARIEAAQEDLPADLLAELAGTGCIGNEDE